MGGVAESVGDVVGDTFTAIGDIAESAVREVGHVAESVGQQLGKVGQAAINDPIGTIAKVTAVATQQYWALPLISAADVVAHGGNLEQAALAAGVSYAGGAVAAGVGDYLGAAGNVADLSMAAEDAKSLMDQGLSSSQVADVLKQSYNFAPEVANNIAAQTILGNSVSEIAKDIGGQMATQNMLANAAGNTAGGATRTALSGGDASQILLGGVTSGAGSLAGGYTSQELKDLGVNNTVANVLGKATGAATASTIGGKDAKLSFINSLINTTLAESGKQVSSELKSAWNSTNDAASKFNDQLTKAQEDYKTKLTPLEQEAKDTQEIAASSYDAYKSVKDKFDSIVAEYNKAKDSGDVKTANDLADQANALLPSLNDATSKYNGDVAAFDSKLATYNSAADDYKNQTDTIAAAKTEYDARNADLQKTTKDFTETALKVADMSDNAKTAFQKLYNDGTTLTNSFDTAKTISGMSDVAGSSFLRQYNQNGDANAALDFANRVNSLDKNSLVGYDNAIKTGLTDEQAFQYAPNISALSKESQQIFLDGIKSGQDPKAAEISAAMAEFFKQSQTQPTTAPAYEPTASVNTTGSATDVGGGATTPLVPKGTVTVSSPDQQFDANAPTIPIPPAEEEPTSPELTADTDSGYQNYLDTFKSTSPDGSTRGLDIVPTPYDQWKQSSDNSGPVSNTEQPTPAEPGLIGAIPKDGETDNAGKVWSETKGEWVTPGSDSGAMPSIPGLNNPSGFNMPSTGGGGSNVGTVKTPVTTPNVPVTSPTFGMPATGTPNYANDYTGGIRNLTPGLTQKMDYTLTGLPNIQETTSPIPHFAAGSSVSSDPFNTGLGGTNNDGSTSVSGSLSPGLTKAQLNYILTGMPGANITAHAEGGTIEEHDPQFFSEGGLGSIENRYVQGEGDGTSDSVAAMLANGEFVIPADVVSKIGNGSNEAGAGVLDHFLVEIRKHAQSNGTKLPPDSKGPLAYLLDAKRKMKA